MIMQLLIAVLLISFAGMIVILFRKVPVLAKLPEAKEGRTKWFLLVKEKCLSYNPLKGFCFVEFLQKILLRTESQVHLWLKKIKGRAQREKSGAIDGYWQQLRETKISAQTNPVRNKVSNGAKRREKRKSANPVREEVSDAPKEPKIKRVRSITSVNNNEEIVQ